jgi:hypothetical protein
MSDYSDFLGMVASEFHRYMMENERVARKVGPNSMVIFRVEGEKGFNKWHEEISLRNREPGQPVTYVLVKSWRKHSLIEEVELVEATA